MIEDDVPKLFVPRLDQKRQALNRSAWRINVPANYSDTGKRKMLFFPSERQALAHAAMMRAQVKEAGLVSQRLTPEKALLLQLLEDIQQETDTPVHLLLRDQLDLLRTYGSAQEIRRLAHIGAEADAIRTRSVQLMEAVNALQEAKDAHQSAYTVSSRRNRLKRFLQRNPELAMKAMAAITVPEIEAALHRTHGTRRTSWNNLHRELSALFSFALRRGWCEGNPLEKIDRYKAAEQEIRALAPEELASLLQACRPPRPEDSAGSSSYSRRLARQDTSGLIPYIAIMAWAGIRPVECTRLTWKDISFEENVISVRAAHSKTGGARHVSIRPVLLAWLRAYRPADADPDAPVVPPESLKFKMSALRQRAGYGASRPWQDDALRHSFASYLVKSGEDLTRIVMDMGHSSTTLLRNRYLNLHGVTAQRAGQYWSITPDKVFTQKPRQCTGDYSLGCTYVLRCSS